MTIRGYIAVFYAVLATGASVFAGDISAKTSGQAPQVMAVSLDWTQAEMPDEFEPTHEGAWERDDLPAYLTEDPADWARGQQQGMAGDAAL